MLEMIYSREREACDAVLLERIKRDVSEGKKITLLVPEQQVYNAELTLSYNNVVSPDLEVVGFRRLCQLIFRRFGGLSYNNITDGARLILMWRTLSEISPMLSEYSSVSLDDIEMIKSLNASVGELNLYAATPRELEKLAEKLGKDNERLARKLSDLALISAANSALLKNNYNDPAEDTKRAAETLNENDYFGGRNVYISHFVSFTLYEKQILENILEKADSTTVFIGMEKGEKRDFFDALKKTEALFLKYAAEKSLKIKRLDIAGENTERAEDISYFAENIFDFSCEKYEKESNNIKIFECDSPEDEARLIASDIAKKIRNENVRYRDFAVVVRNADDYEGIIDKALSEFSLPSFISARTDVKMRPAIRFVLLALKIRAHGWQREDVVSYMRCAFADLTEDDCDLLEEYSATWKISGKRWYDSYGWTMNPRGFGKEFLPEDIEKLEKLNGLRSKLVSPLVKFFETFEKAPTVRSVSASLYNFLTETKMREKLEYYAADLRDRGYISLSDENVQIWNTLVESLDSLVTVAGEMSCNVLSYMKLLSTSLEMSDIGKIPSRIDEIIISEAPTFRLASVKYVYIMGMNEGTFPKAPSEDKILGDSDRRVLLANGLELSPESSEGALDEMFYFYLAASAAEKKLTLTYNKNQNISNFALSLMGLMDISKAEKMSDIPESEFVWSDISSLAYAVSLMEKDMELSENIRNFLKERGNIGTFTENDLISGEYRYSGEKELYGKNMVLSQSRLESYAKCPFAYFCKYVLSLAEAPSGEATSADIGNFVHSFLEDYVEKAFYGGELLSEDERKELFASSIAFAKGKLGNEAQDARVKGLLSRIENTLSLVAKSLFDEFAASEFTPELFEAKIGKDGIKPLEIALPDGGKLSLSGIIDRVDKYEKDGEIYLRVVDYKTGKKVFSRADLQNGINMQMLLYLASLCANTGENRLSPAGVLYFSTKMPSPGVVNYGYADEDEATANALKSMKRVGLLTSNRDVLDAMEKIEPTQSGLYIPIKVNKNGSLSFDSSKILVSDFGELFDTVSSKAAELASGIREGRADATPLKTNNMDGCEYCAMYPVCRRRAYCEEHSDLYHSVPDGEDSYEGGRE